MMLFSILSRMPKRHASQIAIARALPDRYSQY
jgi:hypothetical protein